MFLNYLIFPLQYLCACMLMCVCLCVGQRSFGSSVRCVWQTACSSLGQTLSVIQAQSVIGIWIWANNYNVILTASHRGYYSNWHNIISSDLVAFITHFFMILGNESTVVGKGWYVIKSHIIRSVGFFSASLCRVPGLMYVCNNVFSSVSKFLSKLSLHKLQHCLHLFSLHSAV